ncbi:hypothetical protein Trydic_g22207 [Trypoxylus dichotomus]
MTIRDFLITTNHPNNRYTSGQTVKGKIHFKLHTPKIIRGVYARFRGIARVQWEEKRTKESFGKEETTWETYYGEHEYFDEKMYLIGSSDGESFELTAGEHNYKFEYNLPIGLPTSFDGPLGNVTYTITAVIDVPWDIDDDVQTKLQVISPIDLNKVPYLKNPGHVMQAKHLCCLWCRSGPITVEVNIPKTGFANGEAIHIRADVENLSNVNITMVECKVTQRVTYHSEYPRSHIKEVETPLCNKRLDGVPAHSVKAYDEKLKIPDEPVVNFTNCSLFNVEHNFKIKLYIDGCHTDSRAKMPITLGSIPIKFEESLSVSIFDGLGTPYPYETEQQSSTLSQTGIYSPDQYGWAP